MEEFDLGNLNTDDINSAIQGLQVDVQLDQEVPTDTPSPQPEQVQPPTGEQQQIPPEEPTGGVRGMDQVYDDRAAAGGEDARFRPGPLGYAQDILEGTGRNMYESAAPIVGISDTVIDAINFASAGDTFDIPKLPEYESNTYTALRNISGLVIPSLGLRGMLLKAGTKAHAAGTAAPWLKNLGNSRSFQYFSKFGADIGTAGLVDYVAEQNQKDDNFLGTLKKYWPQTFQWIPNSIATDEDDSPGEKRAKNVNEGAIFGLLASVVEGAAYLTKAGRSMQRTAKFVPTADSTTSAKKLKELTEDEFTNVKFSDKPIEDTALRGFARNEQTLNDLSEYYISRGQEPPDWPMYDVGEKLVRTKDADGVVGAAADAAQIQNNIQSGWGRLGNIVSEAARKEGIELPNLTNRTLVSQVTQELKEAGKFSKTLRSGKRLTERLIEDAGRNLAATLLHPRVEDRKSVV